jgi:iron complex outermembrane recepter protein
MRTGTILAVIALLAFELLPSGAFAADPAAAGTIEGRVLNPATGEFVEKARITVEGTALEAFTDADGFYRLTNVPAGSVKLRAFFTGLNVQISEATVAPEQVVSRDIALSPPAGAQDGRVVKMSEVVVGASREIAGAAIAIHEQRFAPNIKNVVSTDEFGAVAEGNVAEFLKYLPGITIENNGGNGRWISINGVSEDYVPVTVDGFSLASTGGDNSVSRAVEVDMVSINTLSRIEVAYAPTPESPGAALAGTVNMVPRSSFERSRPVFNGSVYLMMRDDSRDFNKTPGPQTRPTRKVHPGFDFAYVAPITDRFGLTFTAGMSSQYSWEIFSQNTWRGGGTATNGAAFPNTTPDKPYLSAYAVADRPKTTWRTNLGATFDYKLTRNDRLSLSIQSSSFEETNTNRTLTFNVGRVLPGEFTTTSTHGAAGGGSLQTTAVTRNRINHTFMPTLTWRHDGPIWKGQAGVGVSHQSQHFRDIDKGFFRTMTAQRSGATIAFDDIFYLQPRRITVSDAAGRPLDPYDLGNYSVTSAISDSRDAVDVQRTAYANLSRNLDWSMPFTLKGGLDLRHSMHDLRGGNPAFNFVGADQRGSTTPIGNDDSAAPFLNPDSLKRPGPFGFPVIQWLSPDALWRHYQARPTQFTTDANAYYRSQVNMSKRAEQVVSSAYLRGDLSLLERRLKLVGGVRAEQTNIDAEGPLTDPTRNFQRDARGNPVLGANGRPLLITSNALEMSRLTFIDRGAHTEKEYLRFFPSVNASFNLRENLIARAAYYHSIGRPNYNQYAGAVTLPDTEADPSSANVIRVNNVAIKPWEAKSVTVRLEYYFAGVGQISVGAFRREIENFFGATTFNATPAFLALYNLDPGTYEIYDVVTQHNVDGTVRMEGYDINYKQALTFLPHWARGVQVFANGSSQRVVGDTDGNFEGYIPRSANWGISLTRPSYNLRVNWNYRGRQRTAGIASGLSVEPGTFEWRGRRLYVDVLGEYYFWKRFALFANLRNLRDQPEDREISGPSTPAHAQFRQRVNFGSLWTFGIKGTF